MWQLESDFEINTATAKKVELELPEIWTLPRSCADYNTRKPLQGSYKQLIAIASQLRFEFIYMNGYNLVRVKHARGYVRYYVCAHFGSPEYTICIIRKITGNE